MSLLDMEYETLSDLSELAEATDGLSNADMKKLGAVVMLQSRRTRRKSKILRKTSTSLTLPPVHTHPPSTAST